VEVVKAKSFRGAAAALGIPNSTLSRRITALESTVGLRLLHRTTRKFEVTEVGQAYFDRSQRIINEARLAHEELGEYRTEPVGVLRISLPADFAMAKAKVWRDIWSAGQGVGSIGEARAAAEIGAQLQREYNDARVRLGFAAA